MSERGAGPSPATWDVLVIGGGLAGLSAAIAAKRLGVSVCLIESAPQSLRGGAARHARNFRAAHAVPTPYSPDAYTADEFLGELVRVTRGDLDEGLARALIADSAELPGWLIGCGVRLQDPGVGLVPYSRRTAFLLGGGKAMVNALYRMAEKIGVSIAYGAKAVGLTREGDGWSLEAFSAGARRRLTARALVFGAGGPGGDPEWLSAHFGPTAETIAVRGGVFSDGRAFDLLVEAGARVVGEPTACHMVAVDARGPRFDGGIVTRVTAIPQGLVVDREAHRVEVAGGEARRTNYARWGPRIAQAPGGLAFLILDAEGLSRSEPTALPPIEAPSMAALTAALGLNAATLGATVAAFNAERGASGRPILTPPFFAVPMQPGLTFVHYGLAVDAEMRVTNSDGHPFEALFAAGMIMAANVLRRGYLAGFGLTLAAVTGRRAGEAAAAHARG